jgi:hypothetical protein
MEEGSVGTGAAAEAAGAAEVAGVLLGWVGAVCAMHAQAIARPPRINRGNTNDVVRPTIFMRVPSLVQAQSFAPQ